MILPVLITAATIHYCRLAASAASEGPVAAAAGALLAGLLRSLADLRPLQLFCGSSGVQVPAAWREPPLRCHVLPGIEYQRQRGLAGCRPLHA